jgi:hypothetical protein
MQALPMNGRTIQELQSAVVLCVFRGIPDNEHEAAAVWTLLYNKIRRYFTQLCDLPLQDFDLIIHRRLNTVLHYPNNRKVHELIATVYCRPGGWDMGALKKALGLGDGPSEISIDWIGELWGSINLLRTQPPSSLLLHRTPYSCIHGCMPAILITETTRALIADNPEFPLSELAYLWMAPLGKTLTSRGLHFIWKAEMRDIQIGANLGRLGFNMVDGNKRDNPSMSLVRETVSGNLTHHQFIFQSPNRIWITATKTAWKKQMEDTLGKMPTIAAGGILSSGTTIQATASTFIVTQPTNINASLSALRETTASLGRQLQALQNRDNGVSIFQRQLIEHEIADALHVLQQSNSDRQTEMAQHQEECLCQLKAAAEQRINQLHDENKRSFEELIRRLISGNHGSDGQSAFCSSPEGANTRHPANNEG